MLLAGSFISSLGLLSFSWIILIAFVGAIIGDNITYFIGKIGGKRLLKRFGRYILLDKNRCKRIKRHFSDHGGKTMFITRFIWGTRLPTTILAGAMEMNYRRFFIYNCLSAFIWASLIGTLGYVFGHSWSLLRIYIKGTAVSLLIFFALAFVVRQIIRSWLRKELDSQGLLR